LRHLLLDWIGRADFNSDGNYFTNPIYNGNEGQGDMIELFNRQAWPSTDIWVGDSVLEFKKTAVRDLGAAGFVHSCNEWLFIGRRNAGTVELTQMSIVGDDAHLFNLAESGQTSIFTKGVLRVKVTFASTILPHLLPDVNATIVIAHTAGDPIYVPIAVNVPAYRLEAVAPEEKQAQQSPPLPINAQEDLKKNSNSAAPAMLASTWAFGILSLLILVA
jgi:hypothetical protein